MSDFPVDDAKDTPDSLEDETLGYAAESSWDEAQPDDLLPDDAPIDGDAIPQPVPGATSPTDTTGAYTPSSDIPVQGLEQTVFTNEDRSGEYNNHNWVGIVGFIIAIVAACTSWFWGYGWFVWLVGAVVSFVGVFFNPKGFAIAGLVISLVGLIILIAACSMVLGAAAAIQSGLAGLVG